MFWARLGPLMASQIRFASTTASSSVSEAYLAKYDAGSRNAVSRSRRNRRTYHRRMSAVAGVDVDREVEEVAHREAGAAVGARAGPAAAR